ncbi:zf-CHY-domain-containing protein [Choiromyces venosus 120613-1]|uniref:Zf-CHY-domain-containing protein n=1 Tax=Choiromyces venosus 120613-1 TaxID=1336337 RepID=A0A3N4IZ12_9PEZI|nr:zf-CHY-domain-containing protein [Choiromyces venosus 120613-1]
MATYAIRFIAPVVERARRWSQSSIAEEPPALATEASLSSPSAPTTPITRPLVLDSVSEAIDIDSEDTDFERTLIIVDQPTNVRPSASMDSTQNEPSPTLIPQPPPSPPAPPSMPPSEGPTVSTGQPSAIEPGSNPARPSVLPEDDGQRELRQKLVEINKLEINERERARRMHLLMTEKYNASRQAADTVDLGSLPLNSAPTIDADGHILLHEENPYKLSPADLARTYYTGSETAESGVLELGCSHYRRGVKLQCSTCEKWYTCRFCHDEDQDHSLVRRETKNMLCMHCGRAQPAQQDCRHCGVRSSRYYCDKCKLWDDDPDKSIYHCNDCGICRIGKGLGKDFFHCKKCGVCMSISLEGEHRCIERSTECDCPICGEYMFTSTQTVVFMTCGHSIHQRCYYEHMRTSYRCPTCARTIINMESQFRALDLEIETQPLPEPYKNWRCLIGCNDCSAKSNVPFHFLGLKCENCKSYNTNQIRILRPEDGQDGGGGNMSPSALPHLPERTTSSNSLLRGQANSPPRLAPAEGEVALANANRAIAAAGEAIMELNGVEDLIIDDGWETEDSADFTDINDDDDLSGFDKDETESVGEEEEDDDDDDEDDDDDDDLIQLIGHR